MFRASVFIHPIDLMGCVLMCEVGIIHKCVKPVSSVYFQVLYSYFTPPQYVYIWSLRTDEPYSVERDLTTFEFCVLSIHRTDEI